MNNIKEFCKKHKKGLILTGCVIGAATLVVITKGKSGKKELIDVTGKSWIRWTPNGGSISLDKAKELLDLNANNTDACFAIVKDSLTENGYIAVLLNDTPVITEALI